MQAQSTDIKKRADRISVALTVKPNTGGQPIWWAVWRDSDRRRMMRTIGSAHLRERPARRNPFKPEAGGRDTKHESVTAARWRIDWERKPGRAPERAYDERAALARGRELVQAREVEIEQEKEAEQGGPKLFGDAADAWLVTKAEEVQDGTLKPSSLKDYRSMLRRPDEPLQRRGRGRTAHVMRAFEKRPIRDITSADIDRFEATLRKAKLAPRTRVKYIVTLSMIFALAEREGWIAENVVQAKGRQKRKGRKKEKLPEIYGLDVVERIAAAVEDTMHGNIVRVAAMTGLRQGELLGLRWRDLDFIGRRLTVRTRYMPGEADGETPKGGKARTVPLGDQAARVLDAESRRDRFTKKGDLIFPNEKGDNTDPSTVRRSYMKARDKVIKAAAKEGDVMPSITFHGLRHTFGSRCAAAGVPLLTIKAWLGHADLQTTSLYMHWQPQSDDADRLSRAFSDGTAAEAAEKVTVS